MLRLMSSLLYPPACPLCEAPTVSDGLCAACWSAGEFIGGAICDGCGAPVEASFAAGEEFICDECLAHPRPWRKARASMAYQGSGRDLVLALKQGGRLELAPMMARWMAAAAAELLAGCDIVVPAVGHWRRTFGRRFDPAAELSRALARIGGKRHEPGALRRVRHTKHQTTLKAAERRANMLDAYAALADRVAGRRVLLIDDVMTTGATLEAAARALMAAGAAQTDVAVFARTLQREDEEQEKRKPLSSLSSGKGGEGLG